jgi:ABC-2 type transport system permease protein
MIDSVRSEWIKVTTLTSIKVLVGIAVAFPIVIVVLTTIIGDGIRDSKDLTDLISGLVLVTVLLIGVVAVMGATGEYTHNTIRPTFAAQPSRLRPLTAKVIVHLVVLLVAGLVVLAVSWLAGSIIVGDDGYFPIRSAFGVTTPTLPAFAGIIVLIVGVTFIGIGLGLLVRNVAVAVAALLLWPLLVESLVRGLMAATNQEGLYKFLPFTQGIGIGFWDIETDSGDYMSRFNGGVYFLAWSIAVLGFGLWRSTASDA